MNVIYEWAVRSLSELGASPFDVFLVIALIGCAIQHARLSAKYQLLNTNHMALWVMIAPDAVKWHHSGEYSIDMKALAVIAADRNNQKSE